MMKSFFKKLAFVMALAMVVSLAAPAATTAAAADAIQIRYQNGVDNPSEINIAKVNGTVDLKFVGAPDFKEAGFEWTSSNPAVATVNQNGEVTAVAAGTAEVTITVGTDRVDTVKVNVVDLPTYTATMGTSSEDLKTELTLEIGDEVDFGFFGIKDYDRNIYQCNWFEAGDGSVVELNAKNGAFKAIGEGTTVISLGVYNVVTGMKHNVASCTVTVKGEEPVATPTPATPDFEVKQLTENDLVLTFNSVVDVEDIKKENIEIYEYYTGEDGKIVHEYIWQINSIKADTDKNTVKVYGYNTTELVDEASYVVRYVKTQGEETVVLAEDTFVASVGEVVKVEASYASYYNNQYEWAFPGYAYTNLGSGEEIEIGVFYTLYDDEGIDVTGHYERATGEDSLITLELITEEAESYFDLDENNDILVFDDIPDSPVVQFKAIYEDYTNDEPVFDLVQMVIEEAPAYKITKIDDWAITIVDTQDGDAFSKEKYKNKDVALYDDYDLLSGDPLENHELVLWFTDSYGNKYVTDSRFAGWKLDFIGRSEKFFGEGYEIHYESRNPQVLVVGDEYDDDTNSSTITTKKVGTATVNVTLYNSFEDEVISRMGTLSVKVKAERYVKSVSANSVSLATDSIPVTDDASVTILEDPNNDGNGDKYDPRFTSEWVDVSIKDQYGDTWGKYNRSAADSITVTANVTNANTVALDLAHADWTMNPNNYNKYSVLLDGVKIREALNTIDDNANSVTFKVTVEDFLNEDEKTATFRASLKNPTLVENEEADNFEDIILKDRLTLATSSLNYTDRKMTISVTEFSKNNIPVNFKDNIELVTTQARYNAVMSKNIVASVGQFFIVVLDPKGNVVPAGDVDNVGIEKHESGLYTFWAADVNDGAAVTEFATAGSYTVKLLEVTAVNYVYDEDAEEYTDEIKNIKTLANMTSKFRLTDNRVKVELKNQDEIYFDNDMIDEITDDYVDSVINSIATAAFTYSYKENTEPMNWVASGVRFKKNTRANSVVIQDVFFKLFFHDTNGDWDFYNDGDAYYYVEIPVDKTVTLEDVSVITDDSVEYRHDPEGNLKK